MKLKSRFDETPYLENIDEIRQSNFKFYKLFNFMMIFLLILLYVSTLFSEYAVSLSPVYVFFIGISALELLVIYCGQGRMDRWIMPLSYFGIAKAYVFCLCTSVIFNRDGAAITYYVFLILIPVTFLLKRKVMIGIQTMAVVVFCAATALLKNPDIAQGDIFSCILFYFISLAMAEQIYSLRIHNVDFARNEKKRNTELETNRNLLKAALDNAGMSVWEYNPSERRIIPVYAAQSEAGYARILDNLPDAAIEGRLIHKDSINEFTRIFAEASEGKTVCQGDIQVLAADKRSYQWRNVCLTAVSRKDGEDNYYIGTTADITKQKNLELQYKEQLRFLDSVNEENLLSKGRWNLTTNEQEMVVAKKGSVLPKTGNVTYDAAMEIVLEGVIPEVKKQETREILNRNTLIEEYQKGNDQYTIICQRKIDNQDIIWISIQLRVCAVPGSNELVALAFCCDISDKMMNQTIVNRLISDEYDFLGTVIAKTGRSIIRSAKPGMDKLLTSLGTYNVAVDFNESVRNSISEMVSKADAEEISEQLLLANIVEQLEREDSYFITFSIAENGEELRRKQLKFCYLDSTKEIIMYYRTDITAVYQMEQEQLHQTKSLLQQAENANAAKSVFLSRMSHDMRTPMNGIIGMTKLMQDLPNVPEEMHTYLNAVEDSGKFLLSLINDTLDMSRIESNRILLKPEVIRSEDLVKNVLATVTPLVQEKQITLEFVPINAELEYIRVDRIRAQQIFMNVMSNAIKFTPVGGKIRMEIECLKRENGIAYDRISVEDNGIGMSEEFLSHIYEPFSQEDSSSQTGLAGTGLGMSIVKHLVELMGGSIQIESKQGKGTKVTVFLNFERVYDYNPDMNKLQETSKNLCGRRVLLVEDHPLNATIAAKLLYKKEVLVERAENGKVAVERFEASKPGYYDAILMDIRMPVMNGIEAARTIRAMERADAKTVPIIATTANAYDEDVEQCMAAGMNAHLAKPIEPEKMYETLAGFINTKTQGKAQVEV